MPARIPTARLALLTLPLVLSACVVVPAHRPAPPPPAYRVVTAPAPEAAKPPPMYFYPERGQTESQQDRDRYECYRWAVRETGVDPGMTPLRQPSVVQVAPAQRDGAPVAAGAITGAAAGAVLSSPRHAGEGMVLGAIFGATLGAIAQENQAQAAERAAERANARNEAAAEAARRPLDNFRRAISACMAGRGYRIG